MPSSLHLAFPILRNNFFRILGPVIEAAIGDPSWEVHLVLGPPMPGSQGKASQNATVDGIPDRFKGRCHIQLVSTWAELAAELNRADAVVSNLGRAAFPNGALKAVNSPLWAAVFDAYHSVLPGHRFDDTDLAFWPSSYYLDQAVKEGLGPRLHLEPRSRTVGWVRADSQRSWSKDATRREWGIDQNRPVVLFIPDGYRLNPMGDSVTDWYRQIWCVDSPVARFGWALLQRRSPGLIRQALRRNWSYSTLIRQLRMFCDKNNAQLVLAQRRRKDWASERGFLKEELAAADHVVPEAEDFPPTMLRAVQMADLVLCPYHSGCVMDTTAAGVPYVTVGLPPSAYTTVIQPFIEQQGATLGHCPGVTWLVPVERFLASFAQQSLADYRLDAEVHRAYTAKYLGPVDGACSQRLLQEIKRSLAKGHTETITTGMLKSQT